MTDYNTFSIKEIKKMLVQKIFNIHKNVQQDFYPEISNQEHVKIKIYQAIDRIHMYLAAKILYKTSKVFSLEDLSRKELIKACKGLEDIDYEFIRSVWHSELKDLFYKQKEEAKIQEKLNRICIIVRTTPEFKEQGFIKFENGSYSIVQSIAEATEFVATNDKNEALNDIKTFIKTTFDINVKTLFNSKMKGRTIYLK